MKVKLLVKRDGCAAGSVVDYGPEMARDIIAQGEAEEFVSAPPEKKKEPAPKRALKSVTKEPAKAGSVVPEEE